MKQPIFFFVAIITVCFLFIACNAQPAANQKQQNSFLKLEASISLPDVKGRIDHLSFDAKHQIVFVAALGNNTVEVIDLKNKKVIHSIKNLHEPQGVAFIPESNSIFITNGDNGQCDIFNASSFQKINRIKRISRDELNSICFVLISLVYLTKIISYVYENEFNRIYKTISK